MATKLDHFPETVPPTADDASLARESSRRLVELLGKSGKSLCFGIRPDDNAEETIAIPFPALRLLADILTEMGKGNTVALIPVHEELTTQQAADMLNVSRPFLIEQLEKKAIPFRKVGKHRRVLLRDLVAYKQKMDQDRLKALEELSAQAQELGMGY